MGHVRRLAIFRIKALAILISVALLSPLQAFASGAEARREYLAGHYQSALQTANSAAERGDSTAMLILGMMHYKGAGVQKDYGAAITWWRKSASKGNAKAQNNLGMVFQNGSGIEKDYNEAVRWYRLSAKQNYALAYSNLGNLSQYGKGVEKDYKKALEYYTKAERTFNQDLLSDPENAAETKDNINFVREKILEVNKLLTN